MRIFFIFAVMSGLFQSAVFAEGNPLVFTLDDFTKRAIAEGVTGKENDWSLAQAGYARDVVMRQTSLPTMAANYSHNRQENENNVFHLDDITDTNQTTLTLNEETPLGTILNASTQYGASTDPAAVSRPSVNASIQQPIYVFVKNSVLRQRQLAQLSFATAKSTYDSAILSLRTQARTAYYNVVQAQEALKVEQHQVDTLQKLLDVTRALVDAGKSAPVETMRSRIRLQVEQSNLDNAQATLDQAALNAKNLIFLPLDADVRFVTQLEFAPFRLTLERLTDYALLHQPELAALRYAQENARLLSQASVEPTRPTFSLNATYNDQQYKDLILTHGWSYTAAANWLFFDSFVARAESKSAAIAVWVADLNLANGERNARVNVFNAYTDLRNTEKQIQYFKLSLDQAARNVDVERLRFQNGLSQLTDVFDAQNELRNLDDEYLGLLVKFNQSKDTLSELLGTDVEVLQ